MRDAVLRLAGLHAPDHAGLAYDVWAPIAPGTGKVPDGDAREGWIDRIVKTGVPDDYARGFARWKEAFEAEGHSVLLCEIELASRLLLGHGNASPTEVGLTLHHTWGVPLIPGSSLKGLLAHYVDVTFGPGETGTHPHDPALDPEQRERARYQGVTWDKHRIVHGPGRVYRELFGAPAAGKDDDAREALGDETDDERAVGAVRGSIVFHDALYVPGSATHDRPLAPDVLTVHQRRYYGQAEARRQAAPPWPCDYDAPNPVAFLTVRPKTRFLLAISGPAGWTSLAMKLLLEALGHWGVGGKTSQGYGRAIPKKRPRPGAAGPAKAPQDETVAALERWLGGEETCQLTHKQVVGRVEAKWLDRLLRLATAAREQAAEVLRTRFPPKVKKVQRKLRTLLDQLTKGPEKD